MEKKTMDTLRTMICGELDDIAKEGKLSHESLDILKDLLESAKDLEKIEHYQKEKEQNEMGMEMDRGYSQRKYFIDADYQPGMASYARGGQGNSYMYHPEYEMPMYGRNGYNRGYSRTGKHEMIAELQELMNETQDAKVREAIQKTINEMNK